MALMSAEEYANLASSKAAEKSAADYREKTTGSTTGFSSGSGKGTSKFSEFGGASTVLARVKAKEAGEPDNWRAYMNGGSPAPKATSIQSSPQNSAQSTAQLLQDALAKQQASQLAQQQAAQKAADDARQAAEQAAAAKKQGYINSQTPLYDQYFSNQQNSQLTALKNARDTSLQGLNSAETTAKQNAYNNSNSVDAQHSQSAQRLREIMASTGLLNSGDNVTQNIQLENQRQSSLNDINQSASNVLQDVAEKRNLTNNQAASQEQALANQISADKTKALIDLQQYGDQKATDLTKFNYSTYADALNRLNQQGQNDIQNRLAEAQLTGQYNGSSTLAAQNAARQDALARAGLTGTLDGQQTMQGQNQAWGQQMDLANLTGQLGNGQTTLAAQQMDRQNKNDNINLAQWLTQTYGINAAPKSDAGVAFDQVNGRQTIASQQFDQQNRGANLDAALKVGQAAGKFIAPQSDWGNLYANAANSPLNFAGQQEMYNQWLQNQQLGLSRQNAANSAANQGANLSLAQQKFEYEKTQDQKKQQAPVTAEDYAKYIDGSVQRDSDRNILNQAAIEGQILSSGLPESEMRKLYQRYGLKLQ